MNIRRAIIGTVLLLACGLIQADEDLLSTAPAGPVFPSQPESRETRLKAGSVQFIREEMDLLIASRPREPFNLPSLDAFTGSQPGSLDFQRIDLFARDSRVRLVSIDGVSDLPRDGRHFFIASNEKLGIGLAVNPHTGETTGYASSFGRKMKIKGNFVSQLDFAFFVPEDEGEAYCGTEMMNQEIGIESEFDQPMALSISAASEGELIS
jgi:hypothetical protein